MKCKPLPVVSIRLSPAILAAADRAAKAAGVERATLLRQLVCRGLGVAEPETAEGFGGMSARQRARIASAGGAAKAAKMAAESAPENPE